MPTIYPGDRYRSRAGNTYRVVAITRHGPEPLAVVARENNYGRWDEGHVYHWPPAAFDGMTPLHEPRTIDQRVRDEVRALFA